MVIKQGPDPSDKLVVTETNGESDTLYVNHSNCNKLPYPAVSLGDIKRGDNTTVFQIYAYQGD